MKKSVAVFALIIALTPLSAIAANDDIVERALAFLGIRYQFASENESKGFDCAGFVRRTFSAVGVQLPRTAADQFRKGCAVMRNELLPGDLVFFKNTYRRGISHVGIYIGEGRFIHAASTARRVVIDRLDAPYYAARFAGGRRVNSRS